MNIAVRYYSKSGNTRAVAEAVAEAVGVKAVSVDTAELKDNTTVSKKVIDLKALISTLASLGAASKMLEYLQEHGSQFREHIPQSHSQLSEQDLLRRLSLPEA